MTRQFLIEYHAAPDYASAPPEAKRAHLQYRMAIAGLRLASQVQSDAGKIIGSLLIVDAADRAAAETLARGDPYVELGYYETFEVRPGEVRFCDLEVRPDLAGAKPG